MSQVTVEQAIQIAIGHHQAGHLQQAESVYRQILAHQPDNADSLHLLGLVLHQGGQHNAAVDLMRRAVAIKPIWPEAFYNLAIAFRANGKTDDAIIAYKTAIAQRPRFVQAHVGLAGIFQETGQLEEAISVYQQCLMLDPNDAEAHNNLGVMLQNSRRLVEAIEAYKKAISKNPDHAQANSNLGIALRQSGQLDQAITAGRRAVGLDPTNSVAHHNLGLALQANGQSDQAVAMYRQAIALDPKSAQNKMSLGIALASKGLLDQAIEAYRQAQAINPAYAAAHNNHGNALMDIGKAHEATAAFAQAHLLQPDNASYDSAFIFSLNYQADYDPRAIAQQHFRWGRQHSRPVQPVRPVRVQAHNHRLRVGYLSPDFRDHPVGRFLLPLLQHHDHSQFEIFCYSDVTRPDPITARFQSLAKHWHQTVTLGHDAVAQLIRDDAIDILVDLTGHTTGSRLQVFAQKPAPLQVSYLGYPCTTGMPTIDYRLTDRMTDPVGLTEHLHTETLYRLPQTNWCFAEIENSLAVVPPPSLCNGYITLGSFNNLSKVTNTMLDTWQKILLKIPNSHLLLKAFAFGSASARDRVTHIMLAAGIAADRVSLLGPQPNHTAHLSTYNQIDIALDTFPYHGTTTTCEALWMGVPVITLAGQSHLSRVGVSLLTNAGLPELIATTPDEYVDLAIALASDADRLQSLRKNLRAVLKQSPLMDALNFSRHIETAYLEMFNV